MDCKMPHLGLATTKELLDELSARVELHALGGLKYRTVDGESLSKGGGSPRTQSSGEANNCEQDEGA